MRPTEARIDLDALRSNYRLARRLAPTSKVLAIVKADAYGHGLGPCVAALASLPDPPEALGVAMIEEALALRRAGITLPIVLLEGCFHRSEIPDLAPHGFEPVVAAEEQLQALLEARSPTPLRVWLKVDSGMHRLGFDPPRVAGAFAALAASDAVSQIVLMTHFANADRTGSPQTDEQIVRFERAIADCQGPRSLANSAALLTRPQTHGDWIRPGILLYGLDPLDAPTEESAKLLPVLTLRSRISAIREVPPGEPIGYGGRYVTTERTRVGVVPVGYADGYPREAPDGTPILVADARTRLIGQPSMDRITVDLTEQPKAQIGTPVELWGKKLSANEVAAGCGTIAYTLVSGVSARVPRAYEGLGELEA